MVFNLMMLKRKHTLSHLENRTEQKTKSNEEDTHTANDFDNGWNKIWMEGACKRIRAIR